MSVGDLGGEVEKVGVIGHVADGLSALRPLVEVLEGEPCLLGEVLGRAGLGPNRLRQDALPIAQVAINLDRAVGHQVDVHVLPVGRLAVLARIEPERQPIDVAGDGSAAGHSELKRLGLVWLEGQLGSRARRASGRRVSPTGGRSPDG